MDAIEKLINDLYKENELLKSELLKKEKLIKKLIIKDKICYNKHKKRPLG